MRILGLLIRRDVKPVYRSDFRQHDLLLIVQEWNSAVASQLRDEFSNLTNDQYYRMAHLKQDLDDAQKRLASAGVSGQTDNT